MMKKIALEEHVSTPAVSKIYQNPHAAQTSGAVYAQFIQEHLWGNIDHYIQEMAQNEIDQVVLSLVSPGIQGIPDPKQAVALAKATNDLIDQTYVQTHPHQFSAFACVALQNPQAAAAELERAVRDLGMKGALVNGYTDLPNGQVVYLDDPSMEVFWDKVDELNVPVYLHPRTPKPDQRQIYQGYPGLVGSAWGYTQETAVHAIRLMMSGLFDRHPNLRIILGHLGEGLSQNLPRTQARLYKQRQGATGAKNQKPLTYYLRTNFLATTSGHFDTDAFKSALKAFGPRHLMFSIDFPYVTNEEASNWFEQLQLDPTLKQQVAYQNAADILNP
ncbi:amidohydrolase [Lactobacillus selangorensis]|uniref:Amidohydrolase n=1 Tax=Lactobacillus selangorensis TaxID=81857 RepID=A0A0R2FX88_9LACO|nr:amidohydrolase [Lactobacillus selangorensis]